ENAHLAGQIIIAVSQPVDEGDCSHWQEVILVDEAAAESQVGDLLERFEAHLDSMPAEVEHRRSSRRAVYRASIAYQEPLLSVSFSPDQAMLLREGGDSSQPPRAWAYTGPVATRGNFV
ncbi:MAG: hypothetical protein J2P37_31975, partial [Ktedonobacteraceae bacterium]|nr:hypothetical protein [Ktedonobacteraceae bacterium]